VSCHLTDFQKTTNPSHAAAGFPQDCSVCHTTVQWLGAKFDHSAATKFPLTGAHVALQCAQCHANNRFAGTPTQCAGCHLTDFQNTKSPNHVTAGFPQDCSICHNSTQWLGAKFDHTARTKFPLSGAHVNVPCAQCHVNNVFAGLSTACAACHMNDYNGATNPNHKAAGFPQDCSMCHTTTQWLGAKFNHSATRFPLTGKHAGQPCAACHGNGVFAGTPMNCDACHLKEYNGTTNPNHQAAGFPKDCSLCHNTTSFLGAVFNHAATGFALTGMHATVPCANCHVNGQFAGTPTACYSCHQTEYQTTTNPNHIAAAFPKTCDTCHTTANWLGATFTHNLFPIYTGSHAGRWNTCNDCHTNPADYSVFSCTNCHAHDKASTDQHHQGVRNYVYNSANCYACHPQGRSD
jgi:hypothetical protein